MDIVITYVDGNDPVWKQDYEKYTNVHVMQKRFRDWGTLKYLLRGVEVNMPFIRNVYLVVSYPTQVPEWADTTNLKIVLHKDIIPEEFLPTFNSNPIEMHLHRIPGLDEEYLYFNDDMYPVDKCAPEDFFRDGKAVIGYSRHMFAFNMYKKICRNSDILARKIAGAKPSFFFMRPQHICSPMYRSMCEEAYSKAEEDVRKTSACRIRTEENLTQYLFLNYQYLKGRLIPEKISNKHISVAMTSVSGLWTAIMEPHSKMLCINDVHLSEERYLELRTIILEAFERKFPVKSRFEK